MWTHQFKKRLVGKVCIMCFVKVVAVKGFQSQTHPAIILFQVMYSLQFAAFCEQWALCRKLKI